MYQNFLLSCTDFSHMYVKILDLVGGWDELLETLIIFVIMEYTINLVYSLIWKNKSKSKAKRCNLINEAWIKNLVKKISIIILIVIATRVDLSLESEGYLRNSLILFFTLNEGISIMKILGFIGLPISPLIKNIFKAFKNDEDMQDEE